MAAPFGDAPQGLTSQILNIANVLTRKGGLKVPRYQRPYTWSGREVDVFPHGFGPPFP